METPVASAVVQVRWTNGVVWLTASHLTVGGTTNDRMVWPLGVGAGVAVGAAVGRAVGAAVGGAPVGVGAWVVCVTAVAAEVGAPPLVRPSRTRTATTSTSSATPRTAIWAARPGGMPHYSAAGTPSALGYLSRLPCPF